MIVSDLPDANPEHWRLGIFYFKAKTGDYSFRSVLDTDGR